MDTGDGFGKQFVEARAPQRGPVKAEGLLCLTVGRVQLAIAKNQDGFGRCSQQGGVAMQTDHHIVGKALGEGAMFNLARGHLHQTQGMQMMGACVAGQIENTGKLTEWIQ